MRQLSKVFYPLLSIAILFFVGRNFYFAFQEISLADLASLNPLNLILSLLSYVLFISSLGLGWIIIQQKGNPLRHLSNLPIYYLTAMGKYAPGKIWTAISKEYFFATDKKGQAVGSGFLEIFATIVSGCLIGSFVILKTLNFPNSVWVILITLILALIAFLPKVTGALIGFVGQKFLQRWGEVSFDRSRLIIAILIDTGAWIVGGLSLYFLLTAFELKPPPELLNTASIFAASYTIGYLAIFLPAGIGVREQIFATLLGTNPHAYLVTLLIRFVSLAGDGALALLGLVGKSRWVRRQRL